MKFLAAVALATALLWVPVDGAAQTYCPEGTWPRDLYIGPGGGLSTVKGGGLSTLRGGGASTVRGGAYRHLGAAAYRHLGAAAYPRVGAAACRRLGAAASLHLGTAAYLRLGAAAYLHFTDRTVVVSPRGEFSWDTLKTTATNTKRDSYELRAVFELIRPPLCKPEVAGSIPAGSTYVTGCDC